jgi:hypothetical protein
MHGMDNCKIHPRLYIYNNVLGWLNRVKVCIVIYNYVSDISQKLFNGMDRRKEGRRGLRISQANNRNGK